MTNNNTDNLLTAIEVAKELEVSKFTVTKWVTQGCPVAVKGKPGVASQFVLEHVIKWVEENIRHKSNGTNVVTINSKSEHFEAKLRKLQADAKLAEIKIEQQEARLISREEMEEQNIKKITTIKAGLLGMGSSLAPRLEGLQAIDIEQAINKYVRDLLQIWTTPTTINKASTNE